MYSYYVYIFLLLCTRVIQKVSSDGLFKKKQEYITHHVYCHLMYILYTTFRHNFHHCWGTYHSVAPVFVSLHRIMVPPAMQSSSDHHAHFRVLHRTVTPITVPLNYKWRSPYTSQR